MRTGLAKLPLHQGKMPRWLFERMKRLAREIILAIILKFGNEEVLTRLADPFWFQAFGCLLGFDWHSSGVTTTVSGALKEALRGLEKETQIFIAGGKGRTSRRTPDEIEEFGERFGINARRFIYQSKLVAKIDNTALQDGYQLYHHLFVFTPNGNWCVVQQGMNPQTHFARRYHWLSKKVVDFVCEPHAAICCDYKSRALNLVAKESKEVREASTNLVRAERPEKLVQEFQSLILKLPAHHPVYPSDLKRLEQCFWQAYERQPRDFEQLLTTEGVGPKTLRALCLLSELIYNVKASREDPVKYSFAHGGKDGYPYPVNKEQYETSIEILREAVSQAKLGRGEKLEALRKLGNLA
jgi:hypothetical protein